MGQSLPTDIVMGQDGSYNWKGWGTLNFETETDAEKAIQVISLQHSLDHWQPVLACSFHFSFPSQLYNIWEPEPPMLTAAAAVKAVVSIEVQV